MNNALRAPAQAGALLARVRPVSRAPAFAGAHWWLFVFLLFAVLPASAQTFPKLAGEPVVDAANLLDPAQEAALNAKLKGIQATSGHQVAVATIPDLEGRDIADYGYRLGRAWGLGSKEKDNGVVLIVAPNERRMRIEVGYGLEPVLTDAYSSVIVNMVMIPQFKAGDYPAGIDAGVDAIAQQIQLPPEQAAARAAQAQAAAQARQSEGGGMPGAFILLIFIGLFVVLPLLRSFGGRRHRRGSGIGEVILWSAINAAINSGDNDGGGWGGGGGGFGGGGGGFSGGGGSFGGGGASGGW